MLTELFDKYNSDKGTLEYGPVYEFYFNSIREKPLKILELGIWQGASLKTWKDYFPNASIIGVDERHCEYLQNTHIATHVGRQEDINFLNSLIAKYKSFDIVIDDCGHFWEPQQVSFNALWPAINSGGLYIIEDLGTSFNPEFSNGFPISTAEYLLIMASNVMADEGRTNSMEFIHFYPNQAIAKKREIV